jgi:hypothetical protein
MSENNNTSPASSGEAPSPSMMESVKNSVTSMFSNSNPASSTSTPTPDTLSSSSAAASASATGSQSPVTGSRIAYLALIAAIVALACFVIAYVLYRLINKKTKSKAGYLLPESKVPILGTELSKLDGSKIPGSGNGVRRTIMFWIYIHDVDKFKGSMIRNVFYRGDRTHGGKMDPIAHSPSVWLDGELNKLHIRFAKNNETQTEQKYRYIDSATTYSVADDQPAEKTRFDLATHGITIDYIPIQRWVHVAVVVNEEVNGGVMYAYLDGELVKSEQSGSVTDSFKMIQLDASGNPVANARPITKTIQRNYSNLNLDGVGDVYVGGSPAESNIGPGFSGLVSGIQFFNYDLNVSDIYNIYVQGPIDNLAAKLGLPAYGVRSPVYRIG